MMIQVVVLAERDMINRYLSFTFNPNNRLETNKAKRDMNNYINDQVMLEDTREIKITKWKDR